MSNVLENIKNQAKSLNKCIILPEGEDSRVVVAAAEAVKEGIYTLSCLVPGIGFLLLALITWFFYPLNKKRVDDNVKVLEAKRAGK